MATAVVLAGAVALASAAYGIGTQTGDGTAEAARDGAARNGEVHFRVAAPFGNLPEELGVDAQELRDAMEDFFEQEHSERRDAFAGALAEALDKPVDEVRAALDEVRPADGDRGRGPCGPSVSLRRLAAALDVTRPELRKALREVRAGVDRDMEEHHADLVQFLAERFNLSEEEVEQALPEPPRPGRFGPGGPPPHGLGALPG